MQVWAQVWGRHHIRSRSWGTSRLHRAFGSSRWPRRRHQRTYVTRTFASAATTKTLCAAVLLHCFRAAVAIILLSIYHLDKLIVNSQIHGSADCPACLWPSAPTTALEEDCVACGSARPRTQDPRLREAALAPQRENEFSARQQPHHSLLPSPRSPSQALTSRACCEP